MQIETNYQLNVTLVSVLGTMLFCLVALLLFYYYKVARDAQTAQLLNAILPERVVQGVSVAHFQQLRAHASEHRKDIRQGRRTSRQAVHAALPVLYSEFLPKAWVAFADIVNFTMMCRVLPAETVISTLNELFSVLDSEASHCQVRIDGR